MSVAYKLLRVKKSSPGQLFPLFVLSDEALPMHVWLTAKEGPRMPGGGFVAVLEAWHLGLASTCRNFLLLLTSV
jgi:hypothetical protein